MKFFELIFFFIIFSSIGDSLSQDDGQKKKFNVVIFFADVKNGEDCSNAAGLKKLKFEEKARVKHCTENTENEPITAPEPIPLPKTLSESSSLTEESSPGKECQELLKTSLSSLVTYGRNVMGMTTAIAALNNNSFTNGLRFKKAASEDFEVLYHSGDDQNLPRLVRQRGMKGLPFYSIFPSGPKLRFNNINKWKSSGVITKPEHTEVFKIRSKRQPPVEDFRKSQDFKSGQDAAPKWDLLGIIGTLKLTFFGKIIDKDSAKTPEVNTCDKTNYQKQQKQEFELKDNLFELVQTTLSNVLQNCESGFLIVIFGGSLSDVSNEYSPLVQSVKHIVENTDDTNTLIIVTGSCPCEEAEESSEDNKLIPVYVKGAKCNKISPCSALYDIPYFVKKILADINTGSSLNHFETGRRKRDLTYQQRNTRGSASKLFLANILLYFIIPYCIILNEGYLW